MSTSVPVWKVVTPQNLEDFAAATPSLIALLQLDPKVSFLLLVSLGAVAKAVAGLSTWPSKNQWQDWLLIVGAGFAAASTFTPAPAWFGMYALALGLIGKGVVDVAKGQFEDAALVALSVVAIILQAVGYPAYAQDALAFAVILKALPGIYGSAIAVAKASASSTSTTP